MNWLKKLRMDHDLTQDELSERTGIAISAISRIENGGVGDYRIGTISRIAAAVGETADRIVLRIEEDRNGRP